MLLIMTNLSEQGEQSYNSTFLPSAAQAVLHSNEILVITGGAQESLFR